MTTFFKLGDLVRSSLNPAHKGMVISDERPCCSMNCSLILVDVYWFSLKSVEEFRTENLEKVE